jgi:hypothetical protein
MAPEVSPAQTGLRSKSTGTTPSNTRIDDGLITLRYEETTPAKPPIAVTVAPPRAPPTDTHPALRRNRGEGAEGGGLGEKEGEERKRDSGLAPTTSSKVREGSLNTSESKDKEEGVLGFKIEFASSIPASPRESVPETPKIKKSESVGSSVGSVGRWKKPGSRKGSLPKTPPSTKMTSPSEEDFTPITTPIPTDSLLDDEFLDRLSFSKRGSVMLSGKKAVNGQARHNLGRRLVHIWVLKRILLIIFVDSLICRCLFPLPLECCRTMWKWRVRKSDRCTKLELVWTGMMRRLHLWTIT